MQDLIHGEVADGYGAVADAFGRNFTDRKELGAAVAVVRDGDVVVDLWGGHRDKKRTKPWERDTLATVFSTTKGMAATAMAVAHSRGLFDLDVPVARYWPEFAQGGKEDVTVRQLLDHEAGLAAIDASIDIDTVADSDRLGAILAEQEPNWAPGTAWGYHAWTLGWYESQLLRRVDPEGRTIGRFFADEVARPLGVEFYIGLPGGVGPDRVATIVGGGIIKQALHARQTPWPLLRRLLNPRSLTFKAFNSGPRGRKLSDLNQPRYLEVELPSVNGTGTALALAQVYGDLAIGGRRLGISQTTLDEIERPKGPALDQIFGLESAFRCGFMKPFPILPFGSSPRAYGHTGAGGSFAFADPETGTGYAYVMNRAGYSLPTDPREIALRDATARCPAATEADKPRNRRQPGSPLDEERRAHHLDGPDP
jgi:CubicO group peptidase (beta-lactamase class C family)